MSETVHFVYVIGHDTGPQKVGMSYDPARRAYALKKAGEPHYKVHYAHPVEPAVAREVEKLAHWLLDDDALGRERFDVTPAVAEQAVRDAATWHAAGQRAPERDPATLVNVRMDVVLSKETLARVHDYRVSQPKIPSLSKAIRDLAEAAMDARGFPR